MTRVEVFQPNPHLLLDLLVNDLLGRILDDDVDVVVTSSHHLRMNKNVSSQKFSMKIELIIPIGCQ